MRGSPTPGAATLREPDGCHAMHLHLHLRTWSARGSWSFVNALGIPGTIASNAVSVCVGDRCGYTRSYAVPRTRTTRCRESEAVPVDRA